MTSLTGWQSFQKAPVFRVTDVDARDVPVTSGRDVGHDDYGPGHHRPFTLPFPVVAPQNGSGRPRGRGTSLAEASRSLSSSRQMQLTSDFEHPEAAPKAGTKSSTFVVETPCRYFSVSVEKRLGRCGASARGSK
jgi:hypothetical protein